MTLRFTLPLLYLALSAATAQNPDAHGTVAAPASPTASAPAIGSTSMTGFLPELDRLQSASTQIAVDLARMRIDKWKTDGDSKRQAQSNADSITRNLTGALPALIEGVRSAPQNLNAEFKLYRNLNALYDVLASLTESAGAFGSRGDYESLAQQLDTIDSVRRTQGQMLEQLTASTDMELAQLRDRLKAALQAAAAPPPPPKKVVVDDNEPPKKKAVHKKSTAKKPTTTPAQNGSSGQSSSGAAKPQS